jgi:TetR/AcrR family transcriptional regulator, repressor of fatR-cypB operon
VETKELLMKVAAELMQEVGYSAMTTSAVAKKAGVAEGTIYRHFPSKEALACAVFADMWRIFNGYVESHLPPREQPIDRLEAFFPVTIAALAALMPTYGSLAQQEHLYFAAHHGSSGELPPECRDYVALLEDAIRLAQRAGRVRPDVDPGVAAHFFFFGAHHAIEYYGDPHNPAADGERVPRAVYDQLFSMMRRALYGEQS